MSLIRTFLLLIPLLLALALPQVAWAHDINTGRIDVTLTGVASATNEVTLTAQAIPGIAVPTLHLTWTLLDGGELLDGPAATSWDLPVANVPVNQVRRVRLPGAGIYKVGVTALLPLNESARFVDSAVLFLVVDASGNVTISTKDPNAVSPMGSIMLETGAQIAIASEAKAPDADPCFTVRGVIQRTERTPTQSGYAPDTLVPVRSALVEMREEDTLFDDSYGEMLTDAQGRYAFSFCDDDGLFDDELELYVRLHAVIRSPQGHDIVEVQEDGLIPPEDVYEFDSNPFDSEGGTYEKNYNLTLEQSGIMNMADAVLDAWTFWNNNGGAVGDDAIFDYQAEINWEAGDELDGSYYNGYVWDHINIADGPADPDQWDDSVIIHEWNHQADDNYGCDDTPGGEHSSSQNLGDLELAWSEGYANYYQSAVRNAFGRTNGNWYLDGDAMGNMGGYDLETRDTFSTTLNTSYNEAAIAAMLWDLEDSGPATDDKQDRTGFGAMTLQQVFTAPNFAENGDIFDDTCTAFVYLWSWFDTGKPSTGAVGAIVQQNIGIRPGFLNGAATASTSSAAAVSASSLQAIHDVPVGGAPEDFRWWKNLTWIVDNSASMAASGKLGAVKTVMKEQVNDLAPAPKGTEFNLYTFNNTSSGLQQPVGQKFYADLVNPAIDALTTIGAADADCNVGALNALAQAAQLQKGGDIWLYTDRSSTLYPSVENTKRLLNAQQIRGSFAMLGGCAGVLPTKMSDVTGGEINYLGNAANGSQSTGIVPYLLTSLGSGGQFIYVREDQLGSAADILRAQVANSAGAGKWSDYVSDKFTYRWDRLDAGEYQWIELLPPLTGDDRGGFGKNDKWSATYDLPQPFSFYGASMTRVRVSLDGYIEFNPCSGQFCIPEKSYLENLRGGPQWSGDFPPAVAAAGATPGQASGALGPDQTNAPCSGFLPNTGWFAKVYSTQHETDWHVISTHGCAAFNANFLRKYQVWLNSKTGEIRYLYNSLTSTDAANATIGVRATAFSPFQPDRAVVVSDKDAAGAFSGMGYKFTPAPPQPSRVYKVAVDSLMEGVGFLQTGYSGRFEPMIVRDPAGNAVDCSGADANVLCITMNNVGDDRMVQYVQVNVNGNVGEWTATIDAQPDTEGTFTFSALAASSIQASTLGERQLPSVGAVRLSVRLPQLVDGNILSAWLQKPDGARFSADFQLFDDGAHGDGRAGDGIFSIPDFVAPGKGVGYLWVSGALGGVAFVRSDPTPYNFQPLAVTMLNKNITYVGGVLAVPVRVTNHDSVQQCFAGYADSVTVPEGWSYQWTLPLGDDGSEQLLGVCIGAGQTIDRELLVTPSQAFFDGPSLATGAVTVAFTERERGAISDSDSTTVTRYREASQVVLLNPLGEAAIRPNSVDTATLTLLVYDVSGLPVVDGTNVDLTTSLGSITVAGANATTATAAGVDAATIAAQTKNGRVTATLTAGTQPGDATVIALVDSKSATATVYIRAAGVHTIDLTASPADLSTGATASALIATVRDAWGDPVAGVNVRIGVSDDTGTQGTLNGAQVVTGTTNANGQVIASFAKHADAIGQTVVRAEYFIETGGTVQVIADDRETLFFSELVAELKIFLPVVVR